MVFFWCVAISNPDSLPSSKAGVKALIWLSLMSESHWWYLFHKEVKSWDSTTWFRIWLFQTPAYKSVSSNASPGWMVRFLGVMIGVFWKRESRPIQCHQRRLLTCQIFFCLHIYSLCMHRPTRTNQQTLKFCVVFITVFIDRRFVEYWRYTFKLEAFSV